MLRQKIKSLLKTVGIEVRRRSEDYLMQTDAFHAVHRLLSANKRPLVFDVGANRGQTVARLLAAFPDATIHAFEPGDDAFAALRASHSGDSRVVPHRLAIGAETGQATFFRTVDDRTSSLGAPRSAAEKFAVKLKDEITVSVRTLDGIADELGIARIDLLKMDIQGGELAALRGASALLARKAIPVIYTEVIFAKLYENQASFGGIADLLASHGYELVGLYGLAHANDRLNWGDAIFTLPSS